MDEIINEVLKFSDNILELGKPILDNRIDLFEEMYNIKLPTDFCHFISQYNGICLMGTEVYGFDTENVESIESVYYYEHFEVMVPQWKHLVPFSPDGGGNFYCFDTNSLTDKGDCPIVFWISNYPYTEMDCPEIVNCSFVDWFKQVMLEWTLESYDYDGNERA